MSDILGFEERGIIHKLLTMTRDKETSPAWALGLKLAEECGEVNEALLRDLGFLRHKEAKEGVINEVADVFNVCLGLLAVHYPNSTPTEICVALEHAMHQKGQKYADILEKAQIYG